MIMASASLAIPSTSRGNSGSARLSIAKETSERAKMLSTKVKNIRNMVAKDPYQLGSNHSPLPAASKFHDIDDIDDTEADLDDVSTSGDEFGGDDNEDDGHDQDRPEHSEPSRQQKKGRENRRAKPSRSPASVVSNREALVSSEEKSPRVTSGHLGSPGSRPTNRVPRRSSQCASSQKIDTGYNETDVRRRGDDTGSNIRTGTRARQQRRCSTGMMLSFEELEYKGVPTATCSTRTKERPDSKALKKNRSPSATTQEDLGYEDTERPEFTSNDQQGYDEAELKNCEETKSNFRAGTKARQQRRCSTGMMLASEEMECNDTPIAASSTRTKERPESKASKKKCSPSATTAQEDLGYEDMERPELTSNDQQRQRREISKHRRSRRASTGWVPDDTDSEGKSAVTFPRMEKTTRIRRTQRVSSDFVKSATIDDVVKTRSTGIIRRQMRRGSTGSLLGSDNDDDVDPFKPGPRRARRPEKGSIHRRRSDKRTSPRKFVEDSNNEQTNSPNDTGGYQDLKCSLLEEENSLVKSSSAHSKPSRRHNRRGSTGGMEIFEDQDPNKPFRERRLEQGSSPSRGYKLRRAKSVDMAGVEDLFRGQYDTEGNVHVRMSTGSSSKDTGIVSSGQGKAEGSGEIDQVEAQNKKDAPGMRSSPRSSRRPGLKGQKAKSERSLKVGDSESKNPSTTNDTGGSQDLKSSRHDDRKDAVHKNRSRFVTQRNFKLAPINRRSKSLRNLLVGDSTALDIHAIVDGHGSGSISSLTLSTGLASKSDFSFASELKGEAKAASSIATPKSQERCNDASSRWQSNPQNSPSSSADCVPTRPEQDLASLCSPGVLQNKSAVTSNPNVGPPLLASRGQAPPMRQHSLLSGHGSVAQSTTSSKSARSLQSLSLEDKNFHGGGRSNLYPEILIPCRSHGYASDVSTTVDVMSALTITPRSDASSQFSSLHSKLQKLSGGADAHIGLGVLNTPGGFVSDLSTPQAVRSSLTKRDIPITPALSIGVSDLGRSGSDFHSAGASELTFGGVSELTFGDSYTSRGSSLLSQRSNNKELDAWMTSVKRVTLHEGEYNRDGAPKMVRRHSLDSVSFVDQAPSNGSSNRQNPSLTKEESDFTPKAPSRQKSLASIMA